MIESTATEIQAPTRERAKMCQSEQDHQHLMRVNHLPNADAIGANTSQSPQRQERGTTGDAKLEKTITAAKESEILTDLSSKNALTQSGNSLFSILIKLSHAGSRKPMLIPGLGVGTRSTYRVGIGDTLRSVALGHPAMRDARLWPLLANINRLTTELDRLGKPVAQLQPDMEIKIPTAVEIEQFKIIGLLREASTCTKTVNLQSCLPPIEPSTNLSRHR